MAAKTAGANDRAGFMDAPEKAPPIRAQRVTVSPMAKPEAALGNRLSVATAMMTNMRAKVKMTSRRKPPARLKFGEIVVAPKSTLTPSGRSDQ